MAHRFLNGMEAAIAISHPDGEQHATTVALGYSPVGSYSEAGGGIFAAGPMGCAEGVLWCARDLLEDRLLHRLHDHVFGVLPEETAHDALISKRLYALADVLAQPEQLDVSAAFCDTRFNRCAGPMFRAVNWA